MFYAISWLIVATLLALWSLAAWVLHSIAIWTVSNAGALSGAASGVGALSLPEWLSPWVSPELMAAVTEFGAGLWSMVSGLLQAAPALAGGVTVATWIVWGLGSGLLLLAGAGLHLLIALWQRRARHAGPGAGAPLALN